MLQADQIARQDTRTSGRAACPQAKLPTYQELLDAALDDTFPASDPLAIGTATQVHEPRTTARDDRDWTLKPGACPAAGEPADDAGGQTRSARCEARLACPLVVDTHGVPAGPCWVEQTSEAATLVWRDADGAVQQVDISLERLRRLLADGLLDRPDPG